MKKWKLFYLIGFIILTILLVIPLFQNVWIQVFFYWGMSTFASVYVKALIFGVVDWSLLLLYIQSLMKDIKRQDATKFDLNK